jgi:hypothetical protein
MQMHARTRTHAWLGALSRSQPHTCTAFKSLILVLTLAHLIVIAQMHVAQPPTKHSVLRMVYPHNNLERDYYVAHTPAPDTDPPTATSPLPRMNVGGGGGGGGGGGSIIPIVAMSTRLVWNVLCVAVD